MRTLSRLAEAGPQTPLIATAHRVIDLSDPNDVESPWNDFVRREPLFVRREPLRKAHECVFGVLALESEPVDPRL